MFIKSWNMMFSQRDVLSPDQGLVTQTCYEKKRLGEGLQEFSSSASGDGV